ncbi:hypothetical protein ABS768_05910 [Flavobacterium sp. ST-75]|uniref:DUF1616 domain-containing protein n=1 Tax=Flavobacterium rhizophilum TaxID=3163296 RepID=A0ABW8Y9Z0_9FLAO
MKKAEIILAVLTLVGILLSVLHIPGGNILAVLTMTILSMVYFCLSFALLNGLGFRDMIKNDNYKEISALRMVGAVLSGIVFSTAIIGILFRWMMWPGAGAMLLVSIPGFLIMLIIVLIKYFTKKELFYRNMLIRIVIIGIPLLVLFDNSSLVRNIRYSDNPELLRAIEEAEQNPEDESLWRKVDSIKGVRDRTYQENREE